MTQRINCKKCGAKGKDYGEHVGILYECDGDFENPCFQEYMLTREA
jgi:hypothetical protein